MEVHWPPQDIEVGGQNGLRAKVWPRTLGFMTYTTSAYSTPMFQKEIYSSAPQIHKQRSR